MGRMETWNNRNLRGGTAEAPRMMAALRLQTANGALRGIAFLAATMILATLMAWGVILLASSRLLN